MVFPRNYITIWKCYFRFTPIEIDLIWVRSQRCACLVTWFCYQMIAKPGNKTGPPSWPDLYIMYHFKCQSMIYISNKLDGITLTEEHLLSIYTAHLFWYLVDDKWFGIITSVLLLLLMLISECMKLNQWIHWGWDKMANIFQRTFWNACSWLKMYKFELRFQWSLFLMVQLTIYQHWFR